MYYAAPTGRRSASPAAGTKLVADLDAGGWLDRVRRVGRRTEESAVARSAIKRLEDALFGLVAPAASPDRNDSVNPSGDTAMGFGNVPFSRDEWVAKEITAYFNVDLRQIRSFGLGKDVERLLISLAMFKIRKLLTEGLRLRTACDLEVQRIARGERITVTRPERFELPCLADVEAELPELIDAVGARGGFGDERVVTVTYRK